MPEILLMSDADRIGEGLIGAAIEVHRELGPGLLESTYEECLRRELTLRHTDFNRQVGLPVSYKGVSLDCGYRVDLLVGGQVIVELKSVEKLEPIHIAQLLTYLKLSKYRVGYLINFNVKILKNGIRRIVNG
jgi:GxxExxY protein